MNKILFALTFLFVGGAACAVDQVHFYSVKTTDAFQTSATQFVKSGIADGRAFKVWDTHKDVASTVSLTGQALASTVETATVTIASGVKFLRVGVSGSSTCYAKINFFSAAYNAANNCARVTPTAPYILSGTDQLLPALTMYAEVSDPGAIITVTQIR